MFEPHVYNRTLTLLREEADYLLRKYFNHVKLRPCGNDKILDVGCGEGTITSKHLFKMFPTKNHTLIGSDKSIDMVNFANSTFTRDGLSFRHLDIETESLPIDMKENFDHVFSFNCFQWIEDIDMASKNFYGLLKPGGDLFMTLMITHPINDAWTYLSNEHVKWSKYLKDMGPRFIMAFHYVSDAEKMITELLTKAGFNVKLCEHLPLNYTYKSANDFEVGLSNFVMFKKKIPIDLYDEFVVDRINYFKETGLVDFKQDGGVTVSYTSVLIYAEKSN